MFGGIARRYDRLNRILSLGADRRWRRSTCEALSPRTGELAADLCSGTGDLALALARRGATVIPVDFSHEMLLIAAQKGIARVTESDCMRLPFPDAVFDLVTVAFGVRNLRDLNGGLEEMRRVLKPGGRLGILEFASPRGPVFRGLYHWYLRWMVPAIGAVVSRRRSAYQYLSSSIQDFADQERMKAILREAGFESVGHIDFTRGISALYLARRPITDP